MLLKDLLESVPGKTYITLAMIVLVLGCGIIASVIYPQRQEESNL